MDGSFSRTTSGNKKTNKTLEADFAIALQSARGPVAPRKASHHSSPIDRDAAEGVGRFAVEQVFAGVTDFMAAIRCESNEPFRISFDSVPLEKVANVERLLPSQYVTDAKNNIAESFREYIEPLIGGPLRRCAHFAS